jgi:hypothetical protein
MMSLKETVSLEKKSGRERNDARARVGHGAEFLTTCPFQTENGFAAHCRSDCEWLSDDCCIVWDIVTLLRKLAISQERKDPT